MVSVANQVCRLGVFLICGTEGGADIKWLVLFRPLRRLARHSVVPRRGHSKTMLELPHRFLSSTTLVVFGAGPSQRSALARPPSAAPLYIHPTLLHASIPPNNQELGVRRSIWGPTLGVGSHGTSHAAFAHNRVRTAWRSLRSPTYGPSLDHSLRLLVFSQRQCGIT